MFGAEPRAHAQSPDELKAARELFQEAYKDEQDKRFESALDKFQRVARVRESAAVRYRIAAVLEAMGRLADARDAFRMLAASKPTLGTNEQEIGTSAEQRAAALEKRIPTLSLTLEGKGPPDLKVSVDGKEVPIDKLGGPVALEPGEHVVTASGTGVAQFESKVRLSEGGAVSLSIPVGARAGAVAAVPDLGRREDGGATGSRGRDPTLGIVALAAGGVLLVTSAVMLAVRAGDISDLDAACPGGACPKSRKSELERTRDQASLFGPLGATAGVLGLGAVGLGVYLLVRGGGEPAPPAAGARAFRVLASPVPGGGAMGLVGSF
jgi:hypothetical protein